MSNTIAFAPGVTKGKSGPGNESGMKSDGRAPKALPSAKGQVAEKAGLLPIVNMGSCVRLAASHQRVVYM